MANTPTVRSEGGIASSHEDLTVLPLRVAPATADQKNRVFTGLIPIACFRVEDLRFEFGLSFVRPEIREEIGHLKALRDAHKVRLAQSSASSPATTLFPPLSIFGHADPVGGDDFNKLLSGRRAKAVYALLTRKTELWEQLHSDPLGNDDWGRSAVRTMLGELGFPQSPAQNGTAALQAFQNDRGLPATGQADSATRSKLYADYMDAICGADFVLDPEDDFLARGKDASGKGDFQGCSDFNLARMFSTQEQQDFDREENHTARNIANAPNRRVVVLLFQPGSYVDSAKWPCPRATEGVAGCQKRFWSDADLRRTRTSERREFKDTEDTFACRFYQRLNSDSPCERRNSVADKLFQLQIRDHEQQPLANTPFTLTLKGKQISGSTDGLGFMDFQTAVDGKGKLEVKDQTYELTFADSLPNDVLHTQALLNALGFNAGPLDGRLGRRTEDALKSFQRTHDLPPTGKIDPPTSKALRQEQVIRELDNPSAPPGGPPASPPPPPKKKARVKAPPKGTVPGPPPTTTVGGGSPPTGDPGKPADPTPAPTPSVVKTEATSRVDLPPPHDKLSEAIIRRFKDMDTDKDGFLSKSEIDAAMRSTAFTGDDGAMVATLKKVFTDFEDFSDDEWGPENDGITQADVTAYDRLREKVGKLSDDQKKGNKDAEVIGRVRDMFSFAQFKIANKSTALFVGDPDVLKVEQGMIGDCWFLCSIVGVGLRDKADILKMVKPAGDKFEVTLPGVSKTLTTDAPTDAELAILSTVGTNGLWLPVIEKAFGSTVDLDAGATVAKGINTVTGHSTTANTIFVSRESTLRSQISGAFASKKIAGVAIRKGMPFTDQRRSDGLPMGHAYTIVSFDDAAGKIKVRNPWGNTVPANATDDHGLFEMSFADFMSDFSVVTTED